MASINVNLDARVQEWPQGISQEASKCSRSDITCHKCGKNGHIKKYFRSQGNGSSANPPKNSTNEPPECVTNKPVVSDTRYLKTATMTCKNKNYKWYTSFNNGQGEWGFH